MKAARIFLFVMIACSLPTLIVGCGKGQQLYSHYTGKPSEICVDGVVYLQFTSGATVKVQPSGQPVTCHS